MSNMAGVQNTDCELPTTAAVLSADQVTRTDVEASSRGGDGLQRTCYSVASKAILLKH